MFSFPSKAEETFSMSWTLCSLEEASQTEPLTWRPLTAPSCKRSLSSAWFREQVYTVAPSSASSSTTACLRKDGHKLRNGILIQIETQIHLQKQRFWSSVLPNSTSAAGYEGGKPWKRPSGTAPTTRNLRHGLLS